MSPQETYDYYRTIKQDMWDYSQYMRHLTTSRPNSVVLEIGVRMGVSTAAFLLGVEKSGGHVYSVDIDPRCGALYRDHPQWTFIHANSKHVDKVMAKSMISISFLNIVGFIIVLVLFKVQ